MTDESIIHFKTARAGNKKLRPGPSPALNPPPERIPRVARLMALAIHFDGLIRKGTVREPCGITPILPAWAASRALGLRSS